MKRPEMLARVRDLLARAEPLDMTATELADEIDAPVVGVGAAFASPQFLQELKRAGYDVAVWSEALLDDTKRRTLIQIRRSAGR